jgi:hypothetical protein
MPTFEDLGSAEELPWSRRAWTSQEMALSKRLLIFTDYQTCFKCQKAAWCEDTRLEMHLRQPRGEDRHNKVLRISGHARLLRPEGRIIRSLGIYLDVVEQHSSPQITHAEDKLLAVEGILDHLDLHGTRYISGIPRLPKYLYLTLLWQPRPGAMCYPTGTRQGVDSNMYPSFSWAQYTFTQGCTWFEEYVKHATPSRDVRFRLSTHNGSTILVVDTLEIMLKISRKPVKARGHPDSVDAFALKDDNNCVVGEIWTTEANISAERGGFRCEGGAVKYQFILLGYCQGIRLARIDRRFLSWREPTQQGTHAKSSFWSPLAQFLCLPTPSPPKHGGRQRLSDDKSLWPTVTVMQVGLSHDRRVAHRKRDGIGTRIAVGSIMQTAWEQARLIQRRLVLH